MKYVYEAHGSEDGILGIFSSKKKAEAVAIDYLHASCEFDMDNCLIKIDRTWNQTTHFTFHDKSIDYESRITSYVEKHQVL